MAASNFRPSDRPTRSPKARADAAHAVPVSAVTSAPEEDLRCRCGSLMARVTARGIELKCRRCKRVVLVAATDLRRGWTAVALHPEEIMDR
jgi:hypothetical protein